MHVLKRLYFATRSRLSNIRLLRGLQNSLLTKSHMADCGMTVRSLRRQCIKRKRLLVGERCEVDAWILGLVVM